MPTNVWTAAATVGQNCPNHGFTIGSLDLIIAAVAIHHGATLITFDDDFQRIAEVSNLQQPGRAPTGGARGRDKNWPQ